MPLLSERCFKICGFDAKKRKVKISGNFHGLERTRDRIIFFNWVFTANPLIKTTLIEFSYYIWFKSFC